MVKAFFHTNLGFTNMKNSRKIYNWDEKKSNFTKIAKIFKKKRMITK